MAWHTRKEYIRINELVFSRVLPSSPIDEPYALLHDQCRDFRRAGGGAFQDQTSEGCDETLDSCIWKGSRLSMIDFDGGCTLRH